MAEVIQVFVTRQPASGQDFVDSWFTGVLNKHTGSELTNMLGPESGDKHSWGLDEMAALIENGWIPGPVIHDQYSQIGTGEQSLLFYRCIFYRMM